MLLDYFGLWYRAYTAGSAGSKGAGRKAPSVVVVEYAGKEYRVPVGELEGFLAKMREEPKVAQQIRRRVRKGKKRQEAPVIRLVEAPEEEIEQVKLVIDRSNEKLHHIWQVLLTRKLQERDDEETLLILMGVM